MGVGEVVLIVLAVIIGIALIRNGVMWFLEKLAESFRD